MRLAQPDEKVREMMTRQDYNCAEIVVLLGNERYGLGLAEDSFRLLSGFGGGMYVRKTCGAISGAIAVLSKLVVADRSHRTEGLNALVSGLIAAMDEAFGATDCKDIMPEYRTEELSCSRTVELTLEVLDRYLKEQHVID